MSYVTIYAVQANGDVTYYGEARNNHGFAPLVWRHLCKQYGLDVGVNIFDEEGQRAIDQLFAWRGTGHMASEDDILVGATGDRVWIAREHVPLLAAACRSFYKRYVKPHSLVDTVNQAAAVMDELLERIPDALGVAFNMCSAVDSFWSVPVEDGEDCRPYNILTDESKGGERYWQLKPEKGGWG